MTFGLRLSLYQNHNPLLVSGIVEIPAYRLYFNSSVISFLSK